MFKNGDTVYSDTATFFFIGEDPYTIGQCYVVDTHTGEVGTIQTDFLSSEPPISLRELNGKALFELWENVWAEVLDDYSPMSWGGYVNSPDTKEAYILLAEKLNYTAGDENVQN